MSSQDSLDAECSRKLVRLQIRNEETLLEAFDILHDAEFSLEEMTFDPQARRWMGLFTREFFEDEELFEAKRVRLFWTKLTFPMARCRVTLTGVDLCEVKDRSRIGRYTFNECQRYKGGYRLFFCELMEIGLSFDGDPKGMFEDLEILERRGSMIVLWGRRRLARILSSCQKGCSTRGGG